MIGLPFAAVLFDVDGTLAHTAGLHFDAFRDAARMQGAGMERAWYDGRKGLDRAGLVAAFAEARGGRIDAARMARDSLALTIARAGAVAVENPPVAGLARRLHRRVPLAVGSNAEAPVVEAVLRGAGLTGLFAAVVTVSEAGRAKPDPAIFALAARRIGVAPGGCLVLEDSAEGLAAAQAAGMAGWDVRDPDTLARIERLAR